MSFSNLHAHLFKLLLKLVGFFASDFFTDQVDCFWQYVQDNFKHIAFHGGWKCSIQGKLIDFLVRRILTASRMLQSMVQTFYFTNPKSRWRRFISTGFHRHPELHTRWILIIFCYCLYFYAYFPKKKTLRRQFVFHSRFSQLRIKLTACSAFIYSSSIFKVRLINYH